MHDFKEPPRFDRSVFLLAMTYIIRKDITRLQSDN